MKKTKVKAEEIQDIGSLYVSLGGNISAISRATGRERETVRRHLKTLGLGKKPLVGGTTLGLVEKSAPLPAVGGITRYILTSAQNNTHVHEEFWKQLIALSNHYDARIMVGTFSYNQNNFGNLAVKAGKKKARERELWFDPKVENFIVDKRVELGKGLVWCGEMNIIPTAVDPLSGLETYSHRKSAIFPHVKLAMRSIATMLGEGTKLNYTTGTVTVKNYIAKKEGLKAEHHHRYAALIVEVNSEGQWWVRQLGYSRKDNSIQDLSICVRDGKITKKNTVESITFGDLHATIVDPSVVEQSHDMLDTLRPKYQFLHDVMEGVSINRHQMKEKNPHTAFHRWLRGFHRVGVELKATADVMNSYDRPWCQMVVPDSNHDGWWLKSWLAKFDYTKDPGNSELFLKFQTFMYSQIRAGLMPKEVNLTEFALREFGVSKKVKFLLADQSFKMCDDKIECGMHGHLGPNGARGTPANLNKIGRRANTGHTHSAGIWNGLYVAGTSSKFVWDYNYGPSSWTHSHIITYPNGQRAIITMFAGKWRA